MTLAEFLETQALTDTAFAARIGVTSEAVRRYRLGARTPKRDMLAKIAEATGGAVQPADFFPSPAPDAPQAEVA